MALTLNRKVQLVAAAIADNMDYIKASVSKLSESDMANKKFGRSYEIYLPDPGKVIQGIKANPDEIDEIPVPIYLDNFNTSVNLDVWTEKTEIEDFTAEVAKPRGIHLARKAQQEIVKNNIFKSFQAVVKTGAPGFDLLSEASEALEDLSLAGDVVDYQKPSVLGKIASSNVGKFFDNDTAKKLYTKAYIGDFANASHVGLAVVPTITVPATVPSASLVAGTAAGDDSFTFDGVSGDGLFAGLAYKVVDNNGNAVKIVDPSGIETECELTVILTDIPYGYDTRANGKKILTRIGIPQIRIAKAGTNEGNPNAWCDSEATSFSLQPILTGGKKYVIGQARIDASLAFDGYKFKDLPGSTNENVATVGGVTVKMSQYGEGEYLEKLIRLDMPFGAGLMDPRLSVTTFLQLN
jgi:hypothetical protein